MEVVMDVVKWRRKWSWEERRRRVKVKRGLVRLCWTQNLRERKEGRGREDNKERRGSEDVVRSNGQKATVYSLITEMFIIRLEFFLLVSQNYPNTNPSPVLPSGWCIFPDIFQQCLCCRSLCTNKILYLHNKKGARVKLTLELTDKQY